MTARDMFVRCMDLVSLASSDLICSTVLLFFVQVVTVEEALAVFLEGRVILDVEKRAGDVAEIGSSSSNRSKYLSSTPISPPPSAVWKLSCRNANSSMRLSSTSSTVMLEAVADLLLADGGNFWDGRKRPASSISIAIMSSKVGKDAQVPPPVAVVPILSTSQFPSAALRRRKLRVQVEEELWANMLFIVGIVMK